MALTKKSSKKNLKAVTAPQPVVLLAQKKEKKVLKEEQEKPTILAVLESERVITEVSNEARDLYNRSRYGTLTSTGKTQLSLTEGYYLLEKGKITILDGRNNAIPPEIFVRKARKIEPNFWIRYCVYREFRDRGYIIKTALKFGADFRVYDRGVKPGEDHAKWIVYPVHEASTVTWYEFAAKNRVAHSTKKRILIAVVDDEDDVSFWEVNWKRP